MKLEEKLVLLRKEKGLSQLKLAEMMNVSRQAVSRWEVGSAIPSTDNLKSLGLLYDIPLEYLLQDDAILPTRTQGENNKAGKDKKRKQGLILTVIIVVSVLLTIAIFYLRTVREPIPIENIEGSVVTTTNEGDFELTW